MPSWIYQSTRGGVPPILIVQSRGLRHISWRFPLYEPIKLSLPSSFSREQVVRHIEQAVAESRITSLITKKKASEEAGWLWAADPQRESFSDAQFEVSARQQIDTIAQAHGFQYKSITFKNYRSRYGHCDRNDNIAINLLLRFYPVHLQEYIYYHELVHTIHKNHSAGFWLLLTKLLPRARMLRREIRSYDYRLAAWYAFSRK